MGASDIEIHDEKTDPNSNIVKDIKDVKRFINDWLSTWKENAEDGGHKWLGGQTDYKTFAKCRIRNESGHIDNFSLEVISTQKVVLPKVYKIR